ncbi:MAG: type IV secretion system DNA-binding domain-containing protein [Acidobacteriota bacterium]|nr:type IV secretion system DNA-binding domain-containing protein [Acidobacteriota bacterium]
MPGPLQFRSRFMVLPLLVFVFSGAIALPFALWFSFALTPLQRQYFPAYVAAAMTGSTAKSVPVWWIWKTAPKRKPELAQNADVISVMNTGHRKLPLKLSPEAQAEGWTGLMQAKRMGRPEDDGPILQDEFFAGESMTRLMLTPLCGFAVLFLLYLAYRERFGGQSKREERHGRRTKGPELVSSFRWYWGAKRNGIRLRLKRRMGLLPSSFRIPKRLESSHILLMGDTGSGKSNAIRQILRQVQKRGETAIVYDPAGEFVQEFYRPERRDLILNPLDARCPFWNLQGELDGRGIEDAIAAAMLPEKQYENGFFTDAPRRILARLLCSGASVEGLLEWMSDPTEIERRLAGTPQAAYLDRKAGPQRAGVLSSLNMIADSLALLPKGGEAKEWFDTGKWRYGRTQWVFLTSKPAMRERILPLHSAWLDLFILQMMEPCVNPAKPVWFVLDELASLNKLPQLHTAMTENRKYGNPVVLGFQGRSQLEKRYGQDAEAMLSQPATKIFFKTSEPRAAKWISETLGEIEVERIRESHSVGDSRLGVLFGLGQRQKSYSMEIATKPLVMASEIAGLEPLRGYIKQQNRVMPVRFALVPKRSFQPEFIERKMTIPEPRLLPPPVAGPVPTQAEGQTSKPAQQPPVELPPKAIARQPRKVMATIPVAKPEPAMPLFPKIAPEEPSQPEPRRSAFKKKEGAAREWKPLD